MFQSLALAYWFLMVCIALVTVGVIILFAMKMSHNGKQRKMALYEMKQRDYFTYLQTALTENSPLKLPPGKLAPLERRVIQDKLIEWIDQFKGEYRERLIELCREAGFVEHDLKELGRLRYGRQIDAAYRLGGMRCPEAVPGLMELLRDEKPGPMAIMIGRSIARCTTRHGELKDMLALLLTKGKSIHHLAADILLEANLDTSRVLLELLEDRNPDFVKVGLVAMWGQAVPEVMPALDRLVGAEHQDVRAEAVKLYLSASPALRDETILKLIQDPDPEVRAEVVQALGSKHASGSIPLLRKALRDADWRVRYNSAESLGKLGEPGFEALCQAAVQGTGAEREIAMQQIESTMQQSGADHKAVEQMIAHNKKRLLYERYFGPVRGENRPAKKRAGVATVGGDYTA
ncbi:HEAT repeat domain-containing protein [Paenibacillus silvae]|uniref:HEAT repeat domain-containing protein n=1 Tax=Paenibacillus silvae TaxID=1325358 RepID=UPI002002CCF9|nr:HEAT repeat domain-containing protein [Paenibacillus silvae]MCK6077420.1 HEAT repeat domain-containing protein [Paenibacillus silvae]MCK6151466.1 HEAT repeat domain-containing protein [Paenibacillus silvae]MCK6270105.1 HEAT repeat domain-containing protein [Paenibacillus silvae]